MGEGGSFSLWCSSLSRCTGTLPNSSSGWEGVHTRAGWGSPGSVGGEEQEAGLNLPAFLILSRLCPHLLPGKPQIMMMRVQGWSQEA